MSSDPVVKSLGFQVVPAGSSQPTFNVDRYGNATFSGTVTVASLRMIDGGTLGITLDNAEYLSGLTTTAVVKRLIGVNASNLVLIDADAAGVSLAGVVGITGLLSLTAGLNLGTAQAIDGTTSINVNEAGADVDFRIESDTNANHFISDAGLNSGAGAFGFGGAASSGAFINEDAPALATSGTLSRHRILSNAAITVSDGQSATLVTSMQLAEPNITLGSGSSLTTGATLYISAAPTEGTNNFALYVAAGATQLEGTLAVTGATTLTGALSQGVATNTTGSLYIGSDTASTFVADTAVASAVGSSATFRKARGTQAARTIVSSGDTLGEINFQGIEDATDYRTAAQIIAKVDGAPGATNDMPGRLEFYTTPDATATPALALTIDNAGALLLGAGTGRLNAVTAAYGAGTAYGLTNTAAAIDFGTTDPAIVLAKAGTYMISGQVNLAYNGATVAAETATVKVRRTNNTAADLGDVVVLDLPAATTLTHTYGIFQIPPFVYATAATDDAITLFANVSAALGAGTIDATAIGTSITATRLY
jgi:hypothetical protein